MRFLVCLLLYFGIGGVCYGQAINTSGPLLSSNTFEQIDKNGVDLINGTFHIAAPALTAGNEANVFSAEMRWNGRIWEINTPSIWTDGDRNLFVNNGRRVDEFDFTSGVGWVPVRGDSSTLACTFWDSDRKVMSSCEYLSQEGIIIRFRAPNPGGAAPANYSPALGNVNANQADVFYPGENVFKINGGYNGELTIHTSKGYGLSLTSTLNPTTSLLLNKDYDNDPVPGGGPGGSTAYYPAFLGEVAHLSIGTPGISSSTRNDKNALSPKSTTQTITDPLNRTWRYTFNSDGDMTVVQRPTGNNLTLQYDGDHRVTSFNNGVSTWLYHYDSAGSNGTTTVTAPDSGQTIVTYVKKKGYARTVRDPVLRTTTYEYDSNSRLTRINYPEGNAVGYEYGIRGNIEYQKVYPKTTLGLPAKPPLVTQAIYDATCTPPASTQAKCNLPNTIIDPKLKQTNIEYNGWGKVTSITKPAGTDGVRPQTRIKYEWRIPRIAYVRYDGVNVVAVNANGVLMPDSMSECRTLASCEDTADEIKTKIDYGPFNTTEANYLVPKTIATGAWNPGGLTATITRTYDDRGNVITEDGPLSGAGDTTTNRYDAMRQLVGTVTPDPDGALLPIATRTTYDGNGQVTLVETGNVASALDADWAGFVVTGRKATGYDGVGRPILEAVAGTGNPLAVTQTGYDLVGRPVCTATRMDVSAFPSIGFAGVLSGGSLPSACAPAPIASAAGPDRVTHTQYDLAGQVSWLDRAYGTPLAQRYASYTYDRNGNQMSVTDANGNVSAYGYDDYFRQNQWTFPSATAPGTPNGADYEFYGYDDNGNRESLKKRDGQTIGYTYNDLNQLIKKTVPDCVSTECAGLPASATRDVYYKYDLQGHQTGAYFDISGGADAVLNSWDALGHPLTSATSMGGVTRTLTYGYDVAGNRLSIQHPDAKSFTFTYDLLGRMTYGYANGTDLLTTITYNNKGQRESTIRSGGSTGYGYDAISRLSALTSSFPGGAANVALGFTLNPASQVVERTRSNPAYAYPYTAISQNYAPNGLNQYASVSGIALSYDLNGNLTSNGSRLFTYDRENRLIGAVDGGGVVVRLSYDPLGRLYETSGGVSGTTRFLYDGDALVGEYDAGGTQTARYVHGPGVDEPLVWFNGASTAVAAQRYLFPDQQGSIVAVTDSNAAPIRINSYDEYGVPNTDNLGRFQYTGQIYLPDLGMYYYKARIYASRLGRFLQTDPIGYKDQMGLYAYVGNDPVNGSDPDGQQTVMGPVYDGLDRATLACGGDTACGLKSWNHVQEGVAKNVAEWAAADLTGMVLLKSAAMGWRAYQAARAERLATETAGTVRTVNTIGGKMNCVNCAIATDATLAGRSASALGGGPFRISALEKFYGSKFGPATTIDGISNAMAGAGAGSRGIVFGSRGNEVGHVFNVVNQKGVVRFLDGQTGKAATFDGFDSFRLLRTNQ